MTTGQRIKAIRKQVGLTQAELAQKLNVPFQSISQWERDIRKPKKETLANIAKELGVDPIELSDDLFDSVFLDALRKASGFDETFREAFLNGSVSLAVLHGENDAMLMYFYDMLNESGEAAAVQLLCDLTTKKEYLKDFYTKTPEELRRLQKTNKPLPCPEIGNPPEDQ